MRYSTISSGRSDSVGETSHDTSMLVPASFGVSVSELILAGSTTGRAVAVLSGGSTGSAAPDTAADSTIRLVTIVVATNAVFSLCIRLTRAIRPSLLTVPDFYLSESQNLSRECLVAIAAGPRRSPFDLEPQSAFRIASAFCLAKSYSSLASAAICSALTSNSFTSSHGAPLSPNRSNTPIMPMMGCLP
jgi:hypothetical protein